MLNSAENMKNRIGDSFGIFLLNFHNTKKILPNDSRNTVGGA
jgi:hypothetical protein